MISQSPKRKKPSNPSIMGDFKLEGYGPPPRHLRRPSPSDDARRASDNPTGDHPAQKRFAGLRSPLDSGSLVSSVTFQPRDVVCTKPGELALAVSAADYHDWRRGQSFGARELWAASHRGCDWWRGENIEEMRQYLDSSRFAVCRRAQKSPRNCISSFRRHVTRICRRQLGRRADELQRRPRPKSSPGAAAARWRLRCGRSASWKGVPARAPPVSRRRRRLVTK